MLRITLSLQQISKRLVAKLTAMSAAKDGNFSDDADHELAAEAMRPPTPAAGSTPPSKGPVPKPSTRAGAAKPNTGGVTNMSKHGAPRATAPTRPEVPEAVASSYDVEVGFPMEELHEVDDPRELPPRKKLLKKKRRKLSRISARKRARLHRARMAQQKIAEEENVEQEEENEYEYEEPQPTTKHREVPQKASPLTSGGRNETRPIETQQPVKRPDPPPAVSFCQADHNAKGAGASKQSKTPMIKAFRIEDVLASCTPHDGVFARRLPQGGCQFFAWPGTPLAAASHAVSTMPETIRTVHAIFGREKTPLDLVLDIDRPVPQEHWSMAKVRPFQKKVLDDVLSVIVEEIEAIGEEIETQVVLQSPNLKKASFHVHTKLRDAAFEDYNSLHGFLHRFHKKIPAVDMQIYRSNGMLRMHRCMKENHTSAIVVFEDKDWNIGFPDGVVPDAAAALHSACIREEGTYSRLLRFDPPRNVPPAFDSAAANAAGMPNEKSFKVLLPRTEREAVENASRWLREGTREADVDEWRSWIRLGINAYRVAYHFRDCMNLPRPAMEELLDAWVEASKKCPAKFRPGVCESRWSTFDINRLSKFDDNEWWPSYQRIGRTAMMNEAADAASLHGAPKPSGEPSDDA